jgi:type VI protein secretion system component Hcp
MSSPWRRLACLSLVLAALVTTADLSAALEVQACLSTGDIALEITSDPAECPSANRIDATSASVSLDGDLFASATRQPLVMSKHVDRTSARLFLAGTRGSFFDSVLVVFFDGTGARRGNRVLSILLTEAWITHFSQGAQDQRSGAPVETVKFEYLKLRIRDDATGSSACWDFNAERVC